ncbi:hypothetical protein M5D96_012023, partial [Drosophila gunungcola]
WRRTLSTFTLALSPRDFSLEVLAKRSAPKKARAKTKSQLTGQKSRATRKLVYFAIINPARALFVFVLIAQEITGTKASKTNGNLQKRKRK